ncbi:DUF4396 domain-containing protein [Candidatus Halobonum tyrrellensis]|uniref:DUF4396 domain-containing protein n=1 Tax=Candidatus Halobonum tyrrellensis G22 TaxID=1324957 RepID=V4IZG9_9EURY|nr:DUF4396 domain-containing protein [Candidatus Halobonum tyrrellensis]ESP88522.1 hypothetical protein K933_08682 [Candidatus Halobonum tyrrellensis G22]
MTAVATDVSLAALQAGNGGVVHAVEAAFTPVRSVLEPALDSWWTLGLWLGLNLVSLGVLRWDVRSKNGNIPSTMKLVWTLSVAYSGPLGLAIYWYAGRTQMDHDSLWKRGFRSTSHCYSGCGLGEVVGITAATIILGFSTLWVTVTTFALAYVAGFALTVAPLMQEGTGFGEAMNDALWSETPSITVMEVVAVGTDLLLAGRAGWTTPLFWTALLFSLTLGFVAAYPVNAALIHVGVKEGMGNPAEMDGSPTASGG